MEEKKTRSIKKIEQKMAGIDADSLRYRVLKSAKDFKTSWIELGQMLYTVWKDKLYKEWGYSEFDAYTSKEIGIRGQTSLKLLRSYSFLEKEEPQYLKRDDNGGINAVSVPTYEAVDVLRRASGNKEIAPEDYTKIRRYVLEEGKDAKEAQKDLTEIIKRNEELEPDEVRRKKHETRLKRFIGVLRALSNEIRVTKALPENIARETEKLIGMIEREMS
ncbi:MAG: hypothetical protein ABIG55_06045 [Candidatus Omnitrophota bacterium]|nr:hypothetical protein [Candidatus Omnitrophota bacterium]